MGSWCWGGMGWRCWRGGGECRIGFNMDKRYLEVTYRQGKPVMRSLIVGGAALAASASLLLADTTEISFPNFSNTTGLQLNGSAAVANTSDGSVLRVAPAIGGQAGSVFGTSQLQAAAFSIFFTFRMTNPGGSLFDGPDNTVPGADGLVFVVQPNSTGAGSGGQGIGYQGLGNSVGVEFDTWQNMGNHDPSSNHAGIDLNGVVDHGVGSPFTLDVTPGLIMATRGMPGWITMDRSCPCVPARATSARPMRC